jgi:hypothetical protein
MTDCPTAPGRERIESIVDRSTRSESMKRKPWKDQRAALRQRGGRKEKKRGDIAKRKNPFINSASPRVSEEGKERHQHSSNDTYL